MGNELPRSLSHGTQAINVTTKWMPPLCSLVHFISEPINIRVGRRCLNGFKHHFFSCYSSQFFLHPGRLWTMDRISVINWYFLMSPFLAVSQLSEQCLYQKSDENMNFWLVHRPRYTILFVQELCHFVRKLLVLDPMKLYEDNLQLICAFISVISRHTSTTIYKIFWLV